MDNNKKKNQNANSTEFADELNMNNNQQKPGQAKNSNKATDCK